MKTYRILILEDDLETLSNILDLLHQVELKTLNSEIKSDIAVTVFSEYTQVENYVNITDSLFDLILLDRDCKLGGSFHSIDTERINPDTIIAISSVPEYNDQIVERGVTSRVDKDYSKPQLFKDQLLREITSKLNLEIK